MSRSFFQAARGLLCGLALLVGTLYSANPAAAATRVVDNCNDSGEGSLRYVASLALDGDVIDLTPLECMVIEITTGQIELPQNNLTLRGRGALAMFARLNSRVFHHAGTGTLRLERMILFEGQHVGAFASGGCIHSEGDVELISSVVEDCVTRAHGGGETTSIGGAIYANHVHVVHSRVLENTAWMEPGVSQYNFGFGGGIAARGHVTVYRSIISNNMARLGGGIYALGGVKITYSTLFANFAERSGAGVQATGGDVTINKSAFVRNGSGYRCGALCVAGTGRTHIVDSTFSQNIAVFLAAGELSDEASITNSTIAFNDSYSTNECVGVIRARHLTLQSTIIAANRCQASVPPYEQMPPYDLGGRSWQGYTVKGANNLIGRSHVPVPADTIRIDPQLDPTLANLGGPTEVHALMPLSPAIDRGNNVMNRQYDQRGPGFPRVKGLRADIGAYER